jgi:hypothetical protein
LFWVLLRRVWRGWKQALVLVQPQTVVQSHRAGFKLYWAWLSRYQGRRGRKCVNRELRELILRMVVENRDSSAWRTKAGSKSYESD